MVFGAIFKKPQYEDRVSIGKGVGVGETAMPAGLMGAILNYDPTQGPRFSTYATNSIEKALISSQKKIRRQLRRPEGETAPRVFGAEALRVHEEEAAAPQREEPDSDHPDAFLLQDAIPSALKHVKNPRGREILQRIFAATAAGERPPSLRAFAEEFGVTHEAVRLAAMRAYEQFTRALNAQFPQLAEQQGVRGYGEFRSIIGSGARDSAVGR